MTVSQAQMDRIEWKLDQVMAALAVASAGAPSGKPMPAQSNAERPLDTSEIHTFTTKQHAVLQMLLRAATTEEIAQRFDVTQNTAKVYVRTIAHKLGVNTRAQIVMKTLETFNQIDDNSYRIMTGGLPKDWDENYTQPDPFAHLIPKRADYAEADTER